MWRRRGLPCARLPFWCSRAREAASPGEDRLFAASKHTHALPGSRHRPPGSRSARARSTAWAADGGSAALLPAARAPEKQNLPVVVVAMTALVFLLWLLLGAGIIGLNPGGYLGCAEQAVGGRPQR